MVTPIILLRPLAGTRNSAEATEQRIDIMDKSLQQFIESVSRLVCQDYVPVVSAGPDALRTAAFALLRATRAVHVCLPLPQRDLQIAIARALLCEAVEWSLDQEEDKIDRDELVPRLGQS
jgi:hypothetical protein